MREGCTLLERKWSRAVCLTEHNVLLRRLPERFELVDRSKLDLLQHHWTVGKERQFNQVNGLALEPAPRKSGSDRQTIFCTAMVEVLPARGGVATDSRRDRHERSLLRAGLALYLISFCSQLRFSYYAGFESRVEERQELRIRQHVWVSPAPSAAVPFEVPPRE